MPPAAASPELAELDQVFSALADPTRRAIVEQLFAGPRRVGELSLPRPIGAPTLSKHLRTLQQAGLVTQTAQGRFRVCTLNPAALRSLGIWIDLHRRQIPSQRAALMKYLGVAADA